MNIHVLPTGTWSLGTPRRPVFFSFTDEGSKPNGPNPPPADSWGWTLCLGFSSGLGDGVDRSNFTVPPIGGGGGGGGGANESRIIKGP